VSPSNLFSTIPELPKGERFDQLLQHRNVSIERIISSSDIDPQRYVQPQDEWVILLQGQAQLEMDGKLLSLEKGDYLFIPAQTPHRVVATSGAPQCIWLAVHIFSGDSGA
jgi:cupin 2 domain-containing protein